MLTSQITSDYGILQFIIYTYTYVLIYARFRLHTVYHTVAFVRGMRLLFLWCDFSNGEIPYLLLEPPPWN